jgi:hypothetical protein
MTHHQPGGLANGDRSSPHLHAKSVGVGIIPTVITAGLLIFLVLFAQHFYLKLVMANIIAFQLNFIWTCAELLDGPDEEEASQDKLTGGDFTY